MHTYELSWYKRNIDGIKDLNNILIEMSQKSTHQDEFNNNESRIRCAIAIVALGMGLAIRGVDLFVHI